MKFFFFAAAAIGLSLPMGAAPADTDTGWKMDMTAEIALWSRPPVKVNAADSSDLPLRARLDLKLLPNADLKYRVAPRRAPKADSFGAICPFKVDRDGLYRVCAGTPIWLDVVQADTGGNVRQDHFEMQHSGSIRKCVVFPLKAGVGYLLQISGSFKPHAAILITPDSARTSGAP